MLQFFSMVCDFDVKDFEWGLYGTKTFRQHVSVLSWFVDSFVSV